MLQYQLPSGRLSPVTAFLCLVGCVTGGCWAGAGSVEVLQITISQPTKLSNAVYQNTSTILASRTGVLAAIYPKVGTGPHFYRISNDGGHAWGPEREGPPEHGGGQCVGTLIQGGAIIPAKDPYPSTPQTRASDWDGRGKLTDQLPPDWHEGWFDTLFLHFSDDMKSWKFFTAHTFIPEGIPAFRGEGGLGFTKGNMVQLPNGDLLSPMAGAFKGDGLARSWVVRSTDQGRTWRYLGTICYESQNPMPQLPGHYVGAHEPSITLLPDGRVLAMLRRQYSHIPAEYLPMSVSWSSDGGKTWTKPQTTQPHLMNISPTLQMLDNGVVACEYGRPGFHIVFSLDNGHSWQDRISFSHQIEPTNTGQFDMIKSGPNSLVAIGSDADGVKVWPISVKRMAVLPARVALTGRVVDERGLPVAAALVERGPNRYSVDDWAVDPLGWSKRVRRGNTHPERTVPTKYVPRLSYRSIQKINRYPTVQTDEQGRYVFEAVDLGEYVLTVESDGYAPQQRHIKVGPQSKSEDFTLKSGRRIRNRVMNTAGKPVGGACVVLNDWHTHTDSRGFFHWSVQTPVPTQVEMKIYKNYSGQYEPLEDMIDLPDLENTSITLKNRS